ncbi:hypothetical protein ACGFXC_02675 [Streptomyces sp. NPDC048507]|uniref:hypothetical protein n=1 Tax=Streptomyces sp. NPDC048507 TaxID=3365560 RepID=UPI00371AF5FB
MKWTGAATTLALGAGLLLAGCSTNECSAGSVCGNSNAVGRTATTGAPAPGPSGETPLTYTVEEVNPWDSCDGGRGVVFMKPPALDEAAAELGRNKSVTNAEENTAFQKRLEAFGTTHEAAPADVTTLRLNVQGKTGRAVTLKNITVKPQGTQPLPKESLRLRYEAGCGDGNVSRFSVNLDKRTPTLEFKEGQSDTGTMRVRGFPVKVSESDPENFEIVAFTSAGLHRFTLSIEWSADGVPGTTEVKRNDKKDFAVASGNGGPQYSYGQDGRFTALTTRMNPEDPFAEPAPGS